MVLPSKTSLTWCPERTDNLPCSFFQSLSLGEQDLDSSKLLQRTDWFQGRLHTEGMPIIVSFVLLYLNSCNQPALNSTTEELQVRSALVNHPQMPKEKKENHLSWNFIPASSPQAWGGRGHKSVTSLHGLAVTETYLTRAHPSYL